MNDDFKSIDPKELNENPFQLIGDQWMLITAGTETSHNSMTASWGSMGILWHKPVCFSFIRPQRYTFEFMEKSNFFTLSFFPEGFKDTLLFFGTKSGRDYDKIQEKNLQPISFDQEFITFQEAKLAIHCKKIYFQDFNPRNFLDDSIMENYEKKDFHRIYIGEIKKVLVKQ